MALHRRHRFIRTLRYGQSHAPVQVGARRLAQIWDRESIERQHRRAIAGDSLRCAYVRNGRSGRVEDLPGAVRVLTKFYCFLNVWRGSLSLDFSPRRSEDTEKAHPDLPCLRGTEQKVAQHRVRDASFRVTKRKTVFSHAHRSSANCDRLCASGCQRRQRTLDRLCQPNHQSHMAALTPGIGMVQATVRVPFGCRQTPSATPSPPG